MENEQEFISTFAQVAVEAVKAGGSIISQYYAKIIPEPRRKADTSYQTIADTASEQAIINVIGRAFPTHGISSEEMSTPIITSSEYEWFVDPMDGTENFLSGVPYFSSCVALCKNGLPIITAIYNLVTDELYLAIRGQGATRNGKPIQVSTVATLKEGTIFFVPTFENKRQTGTEYIRNEIYRNCRRMLDTWCSTLDWCQVARGKAEGIVVIGPNPLESIAGRLMLEEAKGSITELNDKTSLNIENKIIASNGGSLHDSLRQVVSEKVML